MKAALLAVGLVVILGLVGHADYNAQKAEAAQWSCRHQTTETIPTYDQCIANQYEVNGDK